MLRVRSGRNFTGIVTRGWTLRCLAFLARPGLLPLELAQLEGYSRVGSTGELLSSWLNWRVTLELAQLESYSRVGSTGELLSSWLNWRVIVVTRGQFVTVFKHRLNKYTFTCLSVRAIHLEVAHSLDTDSFINAMRRFITRRGQPEEVRSDNGGNFVRGEKELREVIEGWNQHNIGEFLLQRNVRWTFNLPGGSHHGGVWERCIRTVRKVMGALTKEQILDDEGLATLLCEVESIVIGRPVTKVSDDPRDMEALTPNR